MDKNNTSWFIQRIVHKTSISFYYTVSIARQSNVPYLGFLLKHVFIVIDSLSVGYKTRCYTGPYMGNEVNLTYIADWSNSDKHRSGEGNV